jgi:hypothetical protein
MMNQQNEKRERLLALAADDTLFGLRDEAREELSELMSELGEEAARECAALERTAAEILLLHADASALVPSSLRRKLQLEAFDHFEKVGAPRVLAEAPTTTGANVLELAPAPEQTVAPRARTRWAIAAGFVLLVGAGSLVATRVETGRPTTAAALPVVLEAASGDVTFVVTWMPGASEGVLSTRSQAPERRGAVRLEIVDGEGATEVHVPLEDVELGQLGPEPRTLRAARPVTHPTRLVLSEVQTP